MILCNYGAITKWVRHIHPPKAKFTEFYQNLTKSKTQTKEEEEVGYVDVGFTYGEDIDEFRGGDEEGMGGYEDDYGYDEYGEEGGGGDDDDFFS